VFNERKKTRIEKRREEKRREEKRRSVPKSKYTKSSSDVGSYNSHKAQHPRRHHSS
jgi:hypothetical protein